METPNQINTTNVESGDIVARLREHADRVAGGGPSDGNYDPETLEIEHDAADEIKRLRKRLQLCVLANSM